MAYLNHSETWTAGTAGSMLAPPAAAFNRTEWEVIALARNDDLASLKEEPGWFDKLLHIMFGISSNRRLADPRLEALRRLAVFAWHKGHAVPVSAIKAVKAAGFSLEQVELLLANVGVRRQRRPASLR